MTLPTKISTELLSWRCRSASVLQIHYLDNCFCDSDVLFSPFRKPALCLSIRDFLTRCIAWGVSRIQASSEDIPWEKKSLGGFRPRKIYLSPPNSLIRRRHPPGPSALPVLETPPPLLVVSIKNRPPPSRRLGLLHSPPRAEKNKKYPERPPRSSLS